MPRAPRSDDGDTLIEVMIALLVISVTTAALMTGLATSIGASATHRNLATLDTVVRSYAETIKADVQLQAAPLYQDCAWITTTNVGGIPTAQYNTKSGGVVTTTPLTFTPPAGYSVQLDFLHYWNSTTYSFNGDSSTTCMSAAGDQSGIQLFQITATSPTRSHESLQFVVRVPT